jgi:hypothetical protein
MPAAFTNTPSVQILDFKQNGLSSDVPACALPVRQASVCPGLPSHNHLAVSPLPFGETFLLQGGQQTYMFIVFVHVHCPANAPCRAHP